MFFITRSFLTLQQRILFLVLFLLVPVFAFAQEGGSVPDITVEGELVANINLSNATILSQNASALTLEFTLENQGETPQFDIKYGVELMVNLDGGAQVVADSFVGRETLTLSAGQSLSKVVNYPLSGVAPGTYSVWITARTAGGVLLGLGNAGSIQILSANVLEIKADSCRLAVTGLEGTYMLNQGVDVASTEELVLDCVVKNHDAAPRTIVPQFETYRRTVFGDKVTMSYPESESVTIEGGAETTLSFVIPKALVPQAYDVALTLTDTTSRSIVSNRLVAHYVLQGVSATIQNMSFDKTSYVAGEPIKFDFFWTRAADSFEDSRSGGSVAADVGATIEIVDANGMLCAKESLSLTEAMVSVSTEALVDCDKPTASLTLTTKDGTVLDTRSITVTGEGAVTPEVKPSTSRKGAHNALMLVTLIAFSVSLATILVVLGRRKKAAETGQPSA